MPRSGSGRGLKYKLKTIMTIGEQIKSRREFLGKKKVSLARDVDVSDQTITNYESGVTIPDHDTIKKIEQSLEFKIVR